MDSLCRRAGQRRAFGDNLLAFGAGHMLVTSAKMPDSNDDSIIRTASNEALDLGSGSSVTIRRDSGKLVTGIRSDATDSVNGVDYPAYSLPKTVGLPVSSCGFTVTA